MNELAAMGGLGYCQGPAFAVLGAEVWWTGKDAEQYI
jgi:hypothetical protein